jgi:hypothetical protein
MGNRVVRRGRAASGTGTPCIDDKIYSTDLFNAQLVVNDIETVLLKADKRAATSQPHRIL